MPSPAARSSATPFYAQQLPLDTAVRHPLAKALADPLGQPLGANARIGGARRRDELPPRWGELVAGMRSGLVGDQAGQALLLERLLGLPKRGTQDREIEEFLQPRSRDATA
jgi:hypothetical protein